MGRLEYGSGMEGRSDGGDRHGWEEHQVWKFVRGAEDDLYFHTTFLVSLGLAKGGDSGLMMA